MIKAKFIAVRTSKNKVIYNQVEGDEPETGGILYVDKGALLKGEAGAAGDWPEYLYLTIEGG